jgi:hypothetical protein
VKRYSHHALRALCRLLPLFIAVLFIASQTLAALHHVAHTNVNLNANANAKAITASSDIASASQPPSLPLWTALFGHSSDGAENTTACLAWDAAFASAAQLGDTASAPTTVAYSIAAPSPVSVDPVPADFLGIALARAPPRA